MSINLCCLRKKDSNFTIQGLFGQKITNDVHIKITNDANKEITYDVNNTGQNRNQVLNQ